MNRKLYLFAIVSVLFLISLALLTLFVPSSLARPPWEGNAVKSYKFVVEPPTLISLGFEWYVEGDNNHNATTS